MEADLPGAARILQAVRATWPPSALERVGPFDLPAERRGTRRATSARLVQGEAVTADDIAAVEDARPGTIFGTLDGAEDDVADLLRTRGYAMTGMSDLMAGPVAPLTGPQPQVSGFAHWPPLAVCDLLWGDHGNDAERRTPIHRAPGPKAAVLSRHEDRAAGALFAAIHDGLAVLHLVLTLPRFRRQGVGRVAIGHTANWAQANGATHLALPVEASNSAAVALYERAGLLRRGGYRYWTPPAGRTP